MFLLLLSCSSVSAGREAILPEVFYFLSIDNQTKNTSIWAANAGTVNADKLLTVDYKNLSTPNQLFSSHEVAVLNSAISQGAYSRATPDTSGVFQTIQAVWLIDEGNLLIQTSNEICQSPFLNCYGFYELFILNLVSGNLSSIYKVDYHSELTRDWDGCGENSIIHIDQVLLHPYEPKFSLTVKPAVPCSTDQEKSVAIIADYLKAPTTIVLIPLASGLSWSPDGQYLAFYSQDHCMTMCTASIYVMDGTNTTPTILHHAPLANQTPLFTQWIDNRTLIYQWRVSQHADYEVPLTLFWHDVIDNITGVVPLNLEFESSQVFQLNNGGEVNLVGVLQSNRSIVGFSGQRDADTFVSFPPANLIYSNNKFSKYAFTHLQDNRVDVIDVNLNLSTMDLDHFLPPDTHELIYFVSPGS